MNERVKKFKSEKYMDIRYIESDGLKRYFVEDVGKATKIQFIMAYIRRHCDEKDCTIYKDGECAYDTVTLQGLKHISNPDLLRKTYRDKLMDFIEAIEDCNNTEDDFSMVSNNKVNSKIEIFENAEFGKVRIVMINDEPYFVGKDVATILGYSDTAKAIRVRVDDEDKGVDEMATPGGKQNVILINESGLYSLILSSRLPNAKKFKRWVTSEVLPTIRKRGMYATDELLDNPDFAIQILTQLKAEREEKKRLSVENKQLNDTVEQQTKQIIEMEPKVDYYEIILNSPELLTVSEVSKEYGMSAKTFNQLLKDMKIQYKRSKKGNWLLYEKYANEGYTKLATSIDTQGKVRTITKWTQKGRKFLYNFFKSQGIVPTIER